MNLNIYGVGRSGTKVVQLYLSYLIAKKCGRVKINYEPYYWQHRHLKHPNYEGINLHVKSPQFIHLHDKLADRHRRFLEQMQAVEEVPTITKFIRGNGRMEKINELLSPDWNILVFRKLVDVLASVGQQPFNFYSVGHRFEQSFWKGLKKEILQEPKFESIYHLVHSAKDSMLKNAIYWYVMNLDVLDNQVQNKVIVRYEFFKEDLSYLNTRLQLEGLSTLEKRIDLFRGKKIHSNSILETKDIDLSSNALYPKIIYFLLRKYPFYQPRSKDIGTTDFAKAEEEIKVSKLGGNNSSNSKDALVLEQRQEIVFLQQKMTEKLNIAIASTNGIGKE